MGVICDKISKNEIKVNPDKNKKINEENKDNKQEGDNKENNNKENNNENQQKENNNKDNKENLKSNNVHTGTNYTIIKINFLEKSELIYDEKFDTQELIQSLFDSIKKKKNKYAEYDLLDAEYTGLVDKKNEKIGTVFPGVEEADVSIFYQGLDIADDVRKELSLGNTLIASILFDLGDEIGLLIFHKFEKKFSSELIKDASFKKFNHLSSYCNCKNHLYISGGENTINNDNNSQYISDFCGIDLFNTNQIQKLDQLKVARGWHSMIYIPNRYIFIVGGNTNKVESYDIKKNVTSEDSEMIEVRNECTLCCFSNSFLYAFCGTSPEGDFLSTVERCNLRKNKREWTLVNYIKDEATFQECYYVSSFFSDTTLILFSTNENNKTNYNNLLFDLEDEEKPHLSTYDSDKITDVCPEKFLQPINENVSVLIPLVGNTVKLYTLDFDMKIIGEYFYDALNEIMDVNKN